MMKGLLLKDFLVMRSQGKTYLLLCIFYMILGFTQDSPAFFSGFVVIIAMMLPLTTFSYDHAAHWDRFAAATPAGRRDIVRAKYIFALLVLGVALVVCVLLGGVGVVLKGNESTMTDLLSSVLGCGAVGVLINLLLIPLVLRFGVERARVMITAIMAAVFVSIMGLLTLSKQGNTSLPVPAPGGQTLLVLLGILAVLVVGAAVSYGLSQRIYGKKEL